MVKTCLKWLGHVRTRHVETPLRIVDQMEDNLIARDRGRPRKNIGMIYNKTLWHCLTSRSGEKLGCCCI